MISVDEGPARLAWTQAWQVTILVHELMHVRRGDIWVGMLQMAAQSVWWFHPLVWWAGRLASREAERCCDEAVVAELGCDPARYARSLFDVLEQKRVLKPLPAFPGVRPVEVTSKRLERITKLGQGSRKRSPWWCWMAMLLAAALILPGAALMIAAGDDPPTHGLYSDPVRPKGLAWAAHPPYAQPGLPREVFDIDAWIREHGSGQITVETYFLQGTRETIDALGIDWTLMPMEVPPGETFREGEPLMPDAIQFPLKDGEPAPPSRAQIVVVKDLPVTYAILTPEQAAVVVDRFQKDRYVLQAPKITAFNEQPVCVCDCSQSPFVVGLAEGLPQIRLVSEGTILRLRTLLLEENTLRLDYELLMPRIGEVENVVLPGSPGQKPTTTLQVPEIKTARLSGSVELPNGNALLIGGLTEKSINGEAQSTWVMLRLTKVVPDPMEPTEPDLVLKSYDVSDLALADPRLQSLTDLVTSTIAPKTWQKVGGRGSIVGSQADSTLAVSQSGEVHEEITQLFERLRGLQKTQIGLDSRIVRMPAEIVERIGIEFPEAENYTTLTKREDRIFRALLDESDAADIRLLVNVSLSNGRLFNMPIPHSFAGSSKTVRLALHPTTDDCRTVSLAFAVNPKDPDTPLADSPRVILECGQTLLLDVTGKLDTPDPAPMSGDSKDHDPKAHKTCILISPSIKISSRIISIVTPMIIIQGEEEERLGIHVPSI